MKITNYVVCFVSWCFLFLFSLIVVVLWRFLWGFGLGFGCCFFCFLLGVFGGGFKLLNQFFFLIKEKQMIQKTSCYYSLTKHYDNICYICVC